MHTVRRAAATAAAAVIFHNVTSEAIRVIFVHIQIANQLTVVVEYGADAIYAIGGRVRRRDDGGFGGDFCNCRNCLSFRFAARAVRTAVAGGAEGARLGRRF